MNIRAYSGSYAWTVTTGSVYRFTTVQNITCGTCTPRLRRQVSEYPCMSLIVSKQVKKLRCYLQLHRCDSYPTVSCVKLSPKGTGELCVQAGRGTKPRVAPLHILHARLGSDDLCTVLPALHSLTGCDITSNIGTKKAALNAEKRSTCTDLAQRLR